MGTWLLNLPVLAMAGVILVATWLVAAVIYLAVTGLATGEQARAFKASSLRAVILFADAVPGEPAARLRKNVQEHIEDVVTREWPAMVNALDARRPRIIPSHSSASFGLAVVLLAAHSGPFTGQIPVKPTVLQQVMPEVTATQPSG